MESIVAEPRTVAGKAVKSLRKKGLLPAAVYGKGQETQPISISRVDFLKLWKLAGESSLISLKLGNNEKNVLIHDVALDPIKNNPIHVDFYLVDMKKEVEVDVPLEFIGEAEAGKATGGILVKVLHEFKIKALPKDLPHSIVVNVAGLQSPSDSLVVKDIVVPQGITVLNNPDDSIAMIEEIAAAEVETATTEVASTEDAIKNIEVIKEKKPEEETESEEK